MIAAVLVIKLGNFVDEKTLKFVLNVLRRGTVRWSGRSECLRLASLKVWEGEYYKTNTKDGKHKKGDKKFKTYWRCAKCKKKYRDQGFMEVDHIKEIGSYKGNLLAYASRMYCKQSNLQALCVVCHKAKTTASARVRFKRKKLKR